MKLNGREYVMISKPRTLIAANLNVITVAVIKGGASIRRRTSNRINTVIYMFFHPANK